MSRDNRLCHFCSYNAIDNEAHFVLECPLYNLAKDKFPSLFENVILGSLKSFLQSDQQVDTSLYLTEATVLHNSKGLATLRSSWLYFQPHQPFGFLDFKIHFHFTYLNHASIFKWAAIWYGRKDGYHIKLCFKRD